MAKLQPEEVSLVEVAEISATPGVRTATTPFGAPPGHQQRYVGRSVAWKKHPEAMPTEVERGLSKAQGISKKCAGVKGIGVNPLNGETVPQKVICQLKESGKIKK